LVEDLFANAPAFLAQAQAYATHLLTGALAGDLFSLGVVGVVVLILLLFVFRVTLWVFVLIKHAFLSIFILASLALFEIALLQRIDLASPDPFLLAVAIAGTVLGLFAFLVSLVSVKRHAREKESFKEVQAERKSKEEKPLAYHPTTVEMPKTFSTQALKAQVNERSLLAVFSYVVIAQFGIFSSRTFPAPSVEIGLAVFAIFYIAAFVFIRTSYTHYAKAVFHLLTASIFGFVLSLILGHYWAAIPFETLFSLGYFQTDCLVALVTGTAVSLLMGSK
jgi:hypothetical protein